METMIKVKNHEIELFTYYITFISFHVMYLYYWSDNLVYILSHTVKILIKSILVVFLQ